MKKILIIIRREFLMTITRKAYLISLIGIPLLMLIVNGGLRSLISNLARSRDRTTVGVVDQAGIIDFKLANITAKSPTQLPEGRVSIQPYQSLSSGLQELQDAKLDLLCVIERNFIEKGQVKLYTRNIWAGGVPRGIDEFRALLRGSLAQHLIAGDGIKAEEVKTVINRISNPMELNRFSLTDEGELVAIKNRWSIFGRFLVPYGLVLSLTLSIFMSATYLLQATAEEKENRVVEIMLSSVKPSELLWGKILGLGAAAMLQVMAYISVMGIAVFSEGSSLTVTAGDLILSAAFCLIGYLLYAGILAAIGILGGNLHDNSQLVTPLMIVMAIPVMMEFLLIDAPNGFLARTLSYIPLTAPLTMIYRLALSKVPITDIIISLSVVFGSAYLAVTAAAKIFRAASLMYGKRITGTEVMRWFREA